MATKLRGALIGCGMVSQFHLKGWQRIPEVEIVALADQDLNRAEGRRREFVPTARIYTDPATLLSSERLDFVDILAPPAFHKEHCLLAKAARLHVICQKPLSDDLNDARALVAAMGDHPKLFVVHENHRYRPWFQRILSMHREGFFGRPRVVRLTQHDPNEPAEVYKLQAKHGVLLEYGTHLVDMMRALLGEPARVYAVTRRLNPRVQGESWALAIYDYAETTVTIDIAWKPAGLPRGSVVIEGEKGAALYEGTMTRSASARFRLTRGNEVAIDEWRSPHDDFVESFYLFQRDCVDAMLSGRAITQTGVENLKTLLLTFAAYTASDEGRVLNLENLSISPRFPSAPTGAKHQW